jgi:perosamine synthetase
MDTLIPLSSPAMFGNERRYINEALEDNWISAGSFVQVFEQRLMDYFGQPAIVCSSGTSALFLALQVAGIGPGDEVIVPNLTFAAPACAVKMVGAHPILIDVKPDGTMDPEFIENAITRKARAIIPVHLYGMRADMDVIGEISAQHNLIVIEDCCEAMHIRSVGRFGCYSFYANKYITTGEGGALVSNTDDMELAKIFRSGGFSRGQGSFEHRVAGLNHRMTDLQAAIGCAQMERVGHLIDRRHEIAERYAAHLGGFGKWMFVHHPCAPETLLQRLEKQGIEARRVFMPLHQQRPFERGGEFRNSDDIYDYGLCLPTGPHLSDEQVDRVIKAVRGA